MATKLFHSTALHFPPHQPPTQSIRSSGSKIYYLTLLCKMKNHENTVGNNIRITFLNINRCNTSPTPKSSWKATDGKLYYGTYTYRREAFKRTKILWCSALQYLKNSGNRTNAKLGIQIPKVEAMDCIYISKHSST